MAAVVAAAGFGPALAVMTVLTAAALVATVALPGRRTSRAGYTGRTRSATG
jgi:hypothetical protein